MNGYFDQAFDYLMGDEGRTFVNDPIDSGGPTKFGITQLSMSHYKKRNVSVWEIETLTEEEAKQIYFQNYWNPLQCGQMKKIAMSICVFNSGVLYGVGTAARLTQRAANICGATLKVDGFIGEETVLSLNPIKQEEFLKAFHGLVIARIDDIIKVNPKNEKFRHGWTNRTNRLLALNKLNTDKLNS